MCVSVLLLSWPNGETYRLESLHVGQGEEYLSQIEDQGHRSKVKVTWSKKFLMGISMCCLDVLRCSSQGIEGMEKYD